MFLHSRITSLYGWLGPLLVLSILFSVPSYSISRNACYRIISGAVFTTIALGVGTLGYAVFPDRDLKEVERHVLPSGDHREELRLAVARFSEEVNPPEGWASRPRAFVIGFEDFETVLETQGVPRSFWRRVTYRNQEQVPALVHWQHRNIYLVVGTVKDARSGALRAEMRLSKVTPEGARLSEVWFDTVDGGPTHFRPTRGPDHSDAAVADGFRRHPEVVKQLDQWRLTGITDGALNIVALGESSTEGPQYLVIQYGTNPALGFGDGPVSLIRAMISFPRNAAPTLKFIEARELTR